jgi:hypothetical protein
VEEGTAKFSGRVLDVSSQAVAVVAECLWRKGECAARRALDVSINAIAVAAEC